MEPGGLLGENGGSRPPAPVNLRGGPPPRAGDASGSSSNSFSAKWYGMSKNATPTQENCLEEAEDRFDRDPRRHGSAHVIMRRNKFPAANGLRRALIQSQPYSLHDSDLRSASVRADQNAQDHPSL